MAEKKETTLTTTEQPAKPVRKRGRGGTENFPSVISGAKSEDIRRIMSNCLRWYGRPIVKSDDECRERLFEFFMICAETGEMPTVEKLAMALGTIRQTLWEWEKGNIGTPERMDLIKKAKELIATFESEMVTEGKINPIVYIFRAKNYFGLKDQQEVFLAPGNPLGDIQDPEQLSQRYVQGVVAEEPEE